MKLFMLLAAMHYVMADVNYFLGHYDKANGCYLATIAWLLVAKAFKGKKLGDVI